VTDSSRKSGVASSRSNNSNRLIYIHGFSDFENYLDTALAFAGILWRVENWLIPVIRNDDY